MVTKKPLFQVMRNFWNIQPYTIIDFEIVAWAKPFLPPGWLWDWPAVSDLQSSLHTNWATLAWGHLSPWLQGVQQCWPWNYLDQNSLTCSGNLPDVEHFQSLICCEGNGGERVWFFLFLPSNCVDIFNPGTICWWTCWCMTQAREYQPREHSSTLTLMTSTKTAFLPSLVNIRSRSPDDWYVLSIVINIALNDIDKQIPPRCLYNWI